ncbi:MAG: DUF4105 domain-containing protein, partial [Myxococcota bacterium]|nr:DUF4105 domain-containing protein [Myxococcota bacterium]
MNALLPLLTLLATVGPAAAVPELHLLTMGPGDELYTRGGHASLLVVERRPDGSGSGTVYNYGDTDWQDPDLPWKFLKGELTFFLAEPQSLEQTLETYGVQQNRTIYRQRLNLTPEETRAVVARLEHDSQPDNRAYPYHHTNAICTTRIRSVLDDAVGGAIKTQLQPRLDELTVRDYQRHAFESKMLPVLGADLFLGPLHDRQPDLYDVLFQPRRMRDLLEKVELSPVDGAPRVLAGRPAQLTRRAGGPAIRNSPKSSTLVPITLAWFLLGFLGLAVAKGLPRLSAAWVAGSFLPSGVVGSLIVAVVLVTGVPEMASNELLLSFPPTDLLVVPAAIGVLMGRRWPRAVRIYAVIRLAV